MSKRLRFKRSARVQPTVEEKAERQERLDKLLSNDTPDHSPISEDEIKKSKLGPGHGHSILTMKPLRVDPDNRNNVEFGFYDLAGQLVFIVTIDHNSPERNPPTLKVWQARFDYNNNNPSGDKNRPPGIVIEDPEDGMLYEIDLFARGAADKIIKKIAVKFKRMSRVAGKSNKTSKSKKLKKKKRSKRRKTVKHRSGRKR